MNSPVVSHGGQLLDLQSRQFVVFEEVLENFEEPCCEKHEEERQAIVQQVRSAFQVLNFCWQAKENREHRQLLELSKVTGIEFTQLASKRNNAKYHWYSLVLSQWCSKLVDYQKRLQCHHGHRLLRMKMPPGSHEVSQNQLFMQFYIAVMSYEVLAFLDPRIPPMTPFALAFLLQIVERCRTQRNPKMFHMVSLSIEYVIQVLNSVIAARSQSGSPSFSN